MQPGQAAVRDPCEALRCLAREFKIAWGPVWARSVVYFAAIIGVLAGLEALAHKLHGLGQ
jgi:hypothetical protein